MTEPLNKLAGSGPLTADYYNSLGLLYVSQQKHREAIQAFRKALDLDSGCAEAFYNQALSLTVLGRLEGAIESYASALRVRPDFVDAYYNLGNIWQKKGFIEKAIETYGLSVKLKPDFPEAYNNLGLCLKALKRFEQAVECYEKAIELKPDYAEAYNNLGLTLQGQGFWEQAIEKFEAAINLKPDHSNVHYNLGFALNEIDKLDSAASHYRRCIQLKPDFTDAHNNLGAILSRQGRIKEAIVHYRRALEYSPGRVEIYNNLGNALKKSNRIDEALEMYRRALAARPDYAEAYNNMGVALQFRGDYPAAFKNYKKAIELKPEFAEARFNRATIDLLHGNFSRGWQGYEWRFYKRHWKDVYPIRHSCPRWDGSPFPEKRLLVYGEQGFGDTIQFVRYLPQVKGLGGTVILETRKPLLACLQGVEGVDEVVNRSAVGDPAEGCDLVVPLLSLPGIFGTDLESIPAKVPYLHADTTKMSCWKKRIRGSEFKVGLVWAGNPDQENDHLRSIPLKSLMTLADIPGLQLFGLQKGTAAVQAREIPADIGLIDLGPELEDFSDTAAAMANMDLIISVCTAAAHLAGALGVPVWTLIGYAPDWRWMLDRDDSPWYPTMRLFRQPKFDDWQGAIHQLTCELKKMAKKNSQTAHIPEVAVHQKGAYTSPKTLIGRVQSRQPGLTKKADIQAKVNAFPYWYHRIALPQGVVTPGWAPLNPESYNIPKNLDGKRVLDVGAWDGYWTFKALKRGAREVLAIDDFSDYLGKMGLNERQAWDTFDLCREMLGYGQTRCRRTTISVYELNEDNHGRFDVIFFFGTLYRLRYPLMALDRLASICDGEIYVESAILDDFSPYRGGFGNGYPEQMVMEFYPDNQYGNNDTNWWAPSLSCLVNMVKAAGFNNCRGWKLLPDPKDLPYCRGFAFGQIEKKESCTPSDI